MPTSLYTRVPLVQWHHIWHFGRVLVCVGAVFQINWVRSSGASVGLWAEGWMSGQDLGTASKLSCFGICLRGTFNFKIEYYLCPTKTLSLGQNSLFSAWVLPPTIGHFVW